DAGMCVGPGPRRERTQVLLDGWRGSSLGMQRCQAGIPSIEEVAGRHWETARCRVEDDGFRHSLPGINSPGESLKVPLALFASRDRLDQDLHPPAADETIVPAIVAIELKLADLALSFRQQSQRPAFDFCFDAAAAKCPGLRAIRENEHRRPRLSRSRAS